VVSARPQPTPESPFATCASSFEAELDYVYRTLRRHGVSGRDAEDLAQDVFLVMWRRWSDFDPGRSLRSWLAGIAVKIAQRYHRSHRQREIPYDDVDRADETPGPDDQVASSRLRALVLATLASLPDKYRAIFVMHELDGIAVREIATQLELPLFTVHTRLRRGRQRFAAALRELDLAAPEEALRLERAPIAAPAEARERLRARVAALAVRPPPPRLPCPVALGLALAVGDGGGRGGRRGGGGRVAGARALPSAGPRDGGPGGPVELRGDERRHRPRSLGRRPRLPRARGHVDRGCSRARARSRTRGWLECPQPRRRRGARWR
jgi:RNA polymerase sigma-70 factor (ECF subfamily)